jgi:hypothetical protein
LTKAQREAALLGLWKNMSVAFETLQSNGLYPFLTSSGFSEEDLTSNLIYYYRVVRGFSKLQVEDVCEVVSKEASKRIYLEQGGLRKNHGWRPMVEPRTQFERACCFGRMRGVSWPRALATVVAVRLGTTWRYWTFGRWHHLDPTGGLVPSIPIHPKPTDVDEVILIRH